MEKKAQLTEENIEQKEQKAPMLDAFFRIHDYLVAHSFMPIRRKLMDEINWDDRLIAIKGGRGVGKTDFLLSRVKEMEAEWRNQPEPERKKGQHRPKQPKEIRPCLYVNFNDFYFTEHTLVDLASRFVKQGGQYIIRIHGIDKGTYRYAIPGRNIKVHNAGGIAVYDGFLS